MMTSEIDKYLQKVSAKLARMPVFEKEEILNEIKNHIHEAVSRQEPLQNVLDRLGSPSKLAGSYTVLYDLEKSRYTHAFHHVSFFLSTGLTSVVVIPLLFILSILFVVTAVVSFIISVAELFIDIPGGIVLNSTTYTGFPQLIVGIISSVILTGLALLLWKALMKYLKYVAKSYQRIRLK
jgi:uncharacterized membrane protein